MIDSEPKDTFKSDFCPSVYLFNCECFSRRLDGGTTEIMQHVHYNYEEFLGREQSVTITYLKNTHTKDRFTKR